MEYGQPGSNPSTYAKRAQRNITYELPTTRPQSGERTSNELIADSWRDFRKITTFSPERLFAPNVFSLHHASTSTDALALVSRKWPKQIPAIACSVRQQRGLTGTCCPGLVVWTPRSKLTDAP
jgi:hypothetical protein